MVVVVVLARVIEDRGVLAERAFHDLLKGFAFEFGPLDRIIAIGHVGLMMLVVMIFERFLGHVGRKGVMGVRQVGKREGHGMMSTMMGRRDLTGTLIEGSSSLKHCNFGRSSRSRAQGK